MNECTNQPTWCPVALGECHCMKSALRIACTGKPVEQRNPDMYRLCIADAVEYTGRSGVMAVSFHASDAIALEGVLASITESDRIARLQALGRVVTTGRRLANELREFVAEGRRGGSEMSTTQQLVDTWDHVCMQLEGLPLEHAEISP